MASAAPAMAASTAPCLALFRESSGASTCYMGLWTNSNVGGATYPTTLQTKPLYDCACTDLHYCDSSYPSSVSNITVSFAIPICYKLSPQTSWLSDSSGTTWSITTGTTTIGGASFTVINVNYTAAIAMYAAGRQIQIPLSTSGCSGSTYAGPKVYSRMAATCKGNSYQSSWTVVGTSGTSWTNWAPSCNPPGTPQAQPHRTGPLPWGA